ncbi:hypothetical protein EJ05DRAFT_15965 [Pseudovirgaria hyperparasitica]|uniref:Uncharacterized protein n=1 Tax=Pseudovirgaria hyperparasitica TaxID=470096 RepID=A0A6A6WKS3_9PEZI|nr:uncharacterized protein EJ05DRAFT_15965 [Pseudovirgaria hyperparasitica]KAF2762804.1 hypothetical protein EJ05DRAFT_15965 [Pseudovirgaria hyperparasitica]
MPLNYSYMQERGQQPCIHDGSWRTSYPCLSLSLSLSLSSFPQFTTPHVRDFIVFSFFSALPTTAMDPLLSTLPSPTSTKPRRSFASLHLQSPFLFLFTPLLTRPPLLPTPPPTST